jgi:hypothetical protein
MKRRSKVILPESKSHTGISPIDEHAYSLLHANERYRASKRQSLNLGNIEPHRFEVWLIERYRPNIDLVCDIHRPREPIE